MRLWRIAAANASQHFFACQPARFLWQSWAGRGKIPLMTGCENNSAKLGFRLPDPLAAPRLRGLSLLALALL